MNCDPESVTNKIQIFLPQRKIYFFLQNLEQFDETK